MEAILAILIVICLVLVLAVYRLSTNGKNSSLLEMQQRLDKLNEQTAQQLQQTFNLIGQQLSRQHEASDRSSHLIHTRIDSASKAVSEMQGKLLQLEEAQKHIFEIGKDIRELQTILKAPKLRGTMGEIWLTELIAQIIPPERYRAQYRFKSGEICDMAILLRDGIILPIDSKFSMENFSKMTSCQPEEVAGYQKQFMQDTKKRIDEISKKYILPDEGTLDFAFMYVPAENVYYQAFIQQEDDLHLLHYAFSRRVIPVSPSSFYAYLQVILFGLRGMEIEKSARAVHNNLIGLQGEFGKFRDLYEKVGTHLRHAQQSYEGADRKLQGVDTKLQSITSIETELLEDGAIHVDEIA